MWWQRSTRRIDILDQVRFRPGPPRINKTTFGWFFHLALHSQHSTLFGFTYRKLIFLRQTYLDRVLFFNISLQKVRFSMFKKLLAISSFFLAATVSAQPSSCPDKLKVLWMGPVAQEVVKKNPNSPSFIKEIAKADSQKDKGVSYRKIVDAYKCDIFNVGEMGFISFQNTDFEIIMVAYGGLQAMKNPKTCFLVGLVDKATNKREMTQAKLIVDAALPFPVAVNECK